jgi:hypothetical protein
MAYRDNTNGIAVETLASNRQLWALNAVGCLELRLEPGEPIHREIAKELLHDLADAGLWRPKVRAGKT